MIFCAPKRSGNLLQGIKILDGGASLCFFPSCCAAHFRYILCLNFCEEKKERGVVEQEGRSLHYHHHPVKLKGLEVVQKIAPNYNSAVVGCNFAKYNEALV